MSELSDALRAQRTEIAGEVHDRIIPPLFAARMQLEGLAARLGDSAGKQRTSPADASPAEPQAAADIQKAIDFILLAISTSRQLLSDLVPHEPGEKHWDSQLRQALSGRELEFHQLGTLPWDQIDPETAITLTSIVTEAVRNAVRHGEPNRIEIKIEQVGSDTSGHPAAAGEDQAVYRITIVDDGNGFDPSRATDHHGLHLMRLRAVAIGGRLEVSSQPGGPTRILLQWPISPSEPG